ncbi:MAG: Gfo/Idh/MocA family oxidoreductase [Opitutaceae bacterium]|nr:Gfo/Idh/MocA family oxidoreductase [Opitutaceae bacterium]
MPAPSPSPGSPLSRREFLSTSAKLGAFIAAAPYIARGAEVGAAPDADTIKVALIGCGSEGSILANAARPIPGIRFVAVCDIWPYALNSTARRIKAVFKQDVQAFEDYKEMLATVKEIDAVIVATPDFMHAEHTNAALRAGKHVYCEKLMSNTVEGARSMVQTARETKKLLQIGHQRRSNPRYQFARDKIVKEARLLGRITNISGQWHRAVTDDFGTPRGQEMTAEKLAKFGYANMHEFRNWRWFKKYAGGPMSDLGAHQIDIYNWMLGTNPQMCIASGGVDYYKTHEWYDNAIAIYEYPTKDGVVRATYDVLTTTSAGGGYHEYFMGDEGSLKISENPKYTKLYREARAPEWDPHVASKIITRPETGEGATNDLKPWDKPRKRLTMPSKVPTGPAAAGGAAKVDVRETAALDAFDLNATLGDKAIHQPHLENFFNAMRKGVALNCPAEDGFSTAVTVLKVNEAIAARRLLTFEPGDFKA